MENLRPSEVDMEEIGSDTESTVTLCRKAEYDSDSSNEDAAVTQQGCNEKIQIILAQIGFAVGLGNLWRFPYLCQKNGGGAFLIPYVIMLILGGVPLFYLEIAIGQRLKKGSAVGVWNKIHPYLGGVGITSMVVCFLIALYYNMIIAWTLFYFFNSFQSILPWSSCPAADSVLNASVLVLNATAVEVEECRISSSTSYFWYRDALDISPSISEPGHIVWRMSVSLVAAWVLVFMGMFCGNRCLVVKVIYICAICPCFVLVIFLGRSITLNGSVDGIKYMFTPDMSRLLDPYVWRDAATQIFFSLGLGFGGIIAFSQYNNVHNNCKKDALIVSLINCGVSIFASVAIFGVLGFEAHHQANLCMDNNTAEIEQFFEEHNQNHLVMTLVKSLNRDSYAYFVPAINDMLHVQNNTVEDRSLLRKWTEDIILEDCSVENQLKQAESAPGLTFIAFTEAMIHMPGSPLWSILYFFMLVNLGLGSMLGLLEGILTPLRDLRLKFSRGFMIGVLSLILCALGLMFTLQSGMYLLQLFDTYAGTLPLLIIVFFETISVAWIYGFRRFSNDIKDMIGDRPCWFWRLSWCFFLPFSMLVFIMSFIVELAIKTPQYKSYDVMKGKGEIEVDYPPWAVALIMLLMISSIIWIPVVAVKRWAAKLRCKWNFCCQDQANEAN